jgi:protein ImuA
MAMRRTLKEVPKCSKPAMTLPLQNPLYCIKIQYIYILFLLPDCAMNDQSIEQPIDQPIPVSIEQLLLRHDTWRGHFHDFSAQPTIATGFDELDNNLANRGWPLGNLIEICQPKIQAEWQLLLPALHKLPGLIVLLNPPQVPFCQAIIQAGINLERLIVVATSDKNHFIASFIELARASVGAVMAWQPNETLSYTELRKLALATTDGAGLCVIFRSSTNQQQSSPAALRIFARPISAGLELTLFKQKGFLQTQQARPFAIPLPESWKPVLAYNLLTQSLGTHKTDSKPRRLASVTPLRGKR